MCIKISTQWTRTQWCRLYDGCWQYFMDGNSRKLLHVRLYTAAESDCEKRYVSLV